MKTRKAYRFFVAVLALCLLTTGLPVSTFAEAPVSETPTDTPVPTATQATQQVQSEPSEQTTQGTDSTQTSSADSTQVPTIEPTQGTDSSQAPSIEPTQSASPSQSPSVEPTQGTDSSQTPPVDSTQTPAPESSPSPSETPEAGESTPAPVGEGPAWFMDGEQKHYGELEDLLLLTEELIYIATGDVFALTGEAALRAPEAALAPDPEVFLPETEEDEYVVFISDVGPNGEMQEDTIYVWVGKESDGPTDTPTPEPTPPVEVEAELLVTPENYQAGAWASGTPAFTLTVVPDTLTGYSFAVEVDGGEAQAVAENPYTFATEGQHTLVFALLNPNGEEVARSTTYTVWLDATAPTVQAQFDMMTRMLTVTANDAVSGVEAISLDGGQTWAAMEAAKDGSSIYSSMLTAEVPAGSLLVRDLAGNTWASEESYGATGNMGGGMTGGFGGGSFSGGSGGSSTSSRTVSHSSSSTQSTTAYGSVSLEVEDTSMVQLTIGGQELPLTLTLDYDAEGIEEAQTTFTAELAVWNGSAETTDADTDEDEEEPAYDTLILTARDDGAESPYAYRWDFSGDVYKTLFNSGIQYLVLRVGERVTAISTAGFTAGTAYNALKSAGAPSSEFVYSLWMGEPDPALEMEVEVQGERYILHDGEGEMYYYDVYTGAMDMFNAAFGAADAQ